MIDFEQRYIALGGWVPLQVIGEGIKVLTTRLKLRSSAGAVALTVGSLVMLGSVQSAMAGSRCVTDIATTSTGVVTSVNPSTVAVTGRTGGATGNAVTDTNFLVNPPIGSDFTTKDLQTATLGTVFGDADLVNTTGSFVTSQFDAVNVVQAVNPTLGVAIATVTPGYGEGVGGATNQSTATGTDAFACGPGAIAVGDETTALGNGASAAGGTHATAVGASSFALGENATAIGMASNATGGNALAIGFQAQAINGVNTTAIGTQALANGENTTAVGTQAQAVGANATSVGQGSLAIGDNTSAFGQGANAAAANATAVGQGAQATGVNSSAFGQGANAATARSSAFGTGSVANAEINGNPGDGRATALGNEAQATNGRATAVGNEAIASGGRSTAVGNQAHARGAGAVAIGDNAETGTSGNGAEAAIAIGRNATAAHANSTAIGAGASTEAPNQMSFGVASNTYRMAGLTSDESRATQSGPLEVATTDANGHLATDGGQIFRELGRLGAGVAIATALENPDLVGNETFGLAANIGFFEGNSAIAVSAMGVLGRDFFGGGERWAVSGGVGVSINENNFGGQGTDRSVAGRAGVQVSW